MRVIILLFSIPFAHASDSFETFLEFLENHDSQSIVSDCQNYNLAEPMIRIFKFTQLSTAENPPIDNDVTLNCEESEEDEYILECEHDGRTIIINLQLINDNIGVAGRYEGDDQGYTLGFRNSVLINNQGGGKFEIIFGAGQFTRHLESTTPRDGSLRIVDQTTEEKYYLSLRLYSETRDIGAGFSGEVFLSPIVWAMNRGGPGPLSSIQNSFHDVVNTAFPGSMYRYQNQAGENPDNAIGVSVHAGIKIETALIPESLYLEIRPEFVIDRHSNMAGIESRIIWRPVSWIDLSAGTQFGTNGNGLSAGVRIGPFMIDYSSQQLRPDATSYYNQPNAPEASFNQVGDPLFVIGVGKSF